jgi:hypothetical protein
MKHPIDPGNPDLDLCLAFAHQLLLIHGVERPGRDRQTFGFLKLGQALGIPTFQKAIEQERWRVEKLIENEETRIVTAGCHAEVLMLGTWELCVLFGEDYDDRHQKGLFKMQYLGAAGCYAIKDMFMGSAICFPVGPDTHFINE